MSDPRWPVMLFDLDGTLADSIPLILASHDVATQQVLGRRYSEAERASWIGRTLWDIYTELAPDCTEELANAYITWNRAHMHLINPYPGIGELMADLRATTGTLGVVTSKRRPSAQATLDAVGLSWVPVLAAALETEQHKPSPEPLRHALARLDANVSDAVYVGDAVVDVRAAQAAGMASIAVTWGAGIPEELAAASPDHLVTSADELRALLLPTP